MTLVFVCLFKIHFECSSWIPVKYHRDGKPDLSVMSIGFLLNNQDTAIIWRGPKKHAMIRQFLTDVDWSDLDYLLIDTPPGTSDEHISVCETLLANHTVDGALLVSTPQGLSISDVRREISFCKTAQIPIFGLVANFAGYECEHCSECTNIFSVGGVEKLAEYSKLDILASIPIDPKLGECCDTGKNFVELYNGSRTSEIILKLAETVVERSQ